MLAIKKIKRGKVGRPQNADQDQAFLKMCTYLEENDDEQVSISDLRKKMDEYLNDDESIPYDNYYLKNQLIMRFGDSIHIAERNGVPDIITMKDKTSHILRSYFQTQSQKSDEDSQKKEIIQTAARLIKSDIKTSIPSDTNQYPSTEMLNLTYSLQYVPSTLRQFLELLFVGNDTRRKVASIGQAMIQAARPRATIVPLQIGLGVQVHHLYRSKFLVETLSEMGFCSSYHEVQLFEKNAANVTAPNMLGDGLNSDVTVHFAADNVDHNIQTIDGKGTFHGMGMIAAMTPGQLEKRVIPRHVLSNLNIIQKTKVDLIEYRFASHSCRSIKFKAIEKLTTLEQDFPIDLLWELSFSFADEEVPNWGGMMHALHEKREHPGQSSIMFLPLIDLYSGDETCIMSTLSFICKLAKQYNVSPILTFDQPLYWKAAEIIADAKNGSNVKNIVLMLGCFHTFMNLLGAIGTLMQGSGLKDILETVYGENSVLHMLTGKASQRAFRGHLLVDKCLNQMIISSMGDTESDVQPLVNETSSLFVSVLKGESTVASIISSEKLNTIKMKLDKKKTDLSDMSKTSQLWLTYQRLLKVARLLVTAERSGSWNMHLTAIAACLPIFGAAGHYNYLKSGYLYLQQMKELEHTHPAVYRRFCAGLHVIRRSNKFWAGLSADLVIEQTLMRSLKSSGGLTHGSGMTEQQRAIWTMSMPITSEYNSALQEFNGLEYTTNEQHKEVSAARIQRDSSDLVKISTKLLAHTPFQSDPSLKNIITGVVAADDVDVHESERVGQNIIDKMVGQPIFTMSFKRKDKAKTLGEMSAVKVESERSIDPALLFQRFIVVSKSEELSLSEVLEYELSSFPPALFQARGVFHKADKPQLLHAISDYATDAVSEVRPQTEHYVLDGGSLLHRIPWNPGDSYGSIAKSYADFTVRHYGTATVVFDGYDNGPSIKDVTQKTRGQNNHPCINFNSQTEFSGKKDAFLSRKSNKQRLIRLISDELRNAQCHVINAPGDADVDIVKAAIASSITKSTTLIGEDTDLLVLLLHYAQERSKELYFYSDKATKTPRVFHITHLKSILGEDICSQLLFLHAFTGCDTTSKVFGISKKSAFQRLTQHDHVLESCAENFLLQHQSQVVIEKLGSKAMVALFHGKHSQTLDSLRYNTFKRKISIAKSFVAPERLPPTESATKYHSLRVYYQIMVWMGKADDLDVKTWGWTNEDTYLAPVMCEKSAAPEYLLKMIHCNCTTGCKTGRCSCRKSGLPCHSVCGSCQLDICHNPMNPLMNESVDEVDE